MVSCKLLLPIEPAISLMLGAIMTLVFRMIIAPLSLTVGAGLTVIAIGGDFTPMVIASSAALTVRR